MDFSYIYSVSGDQHHYLSISPCTIYWILLCAVRIMTIWSVQFKIDWKLIIVLYNSLRQSTEKKKTTSVFSNMNNIINLIYLNYVNYMLNAKPLFKPKSNYSGIKWKSCAAIKWIMNNEKKLFHEFIIQCYLNRFFVAIYVVFYKVILTRAIFTQKLKLFLVSEQQKRKFGFYFKIHRRIQNEQKALIWKKNRENLTKENIDTTRVIYYSALPIEILIHSIVHWTNEKFNKFRFHIVSQKQKPPDQSRIISFCMSYKHKVRTHIGENNYFFDGFQLIFFIVFRPFFHFSSIFFIFRPFFFSFCILFSFFVFFFIFHRFLLCPSP